MNLRIETVCTGDELLTGLTSDTNSRFFQELLLERVGVHVRRSAVVGDVREDIIEALNAAAARCDFVLVSGGLGPTADDLTAECAATAAGVGLVESAEALAHLEALFKKRGFTLTENNRRQAQVPQGAEVVLNSEGTAPMFIQRRGSCTLFYVPGVPREYKHLVRSHVVPRIEATVTRESVSVLRLLKTMSLPESHLDARVRPLFVKHPQVTFGFRTHAPENHLKLLATGKTLEEAKQVLELAEKDSRAVLGTHVFGVDNESLAGVVLETLRARSETLAAAESCTGGMVSSLLTEVPGSSDVFRGGAVVYHPELKSLFAHVEPQLIEQHGAVSAEVAEALARGIRATSNASWGIASTGYAGPTGGDERHPIGTVFLAVANRNDVTVEKHTLHGERERIRRFAAYVAIDLLRRTLAATQKDSTENHSAEKVLATAAHR